ncbi:Rieske (2Fe-2S) protein [Marinobacter salicampi]|uniref:Rieske (2Fe-2S) protein n=1 Tax=Marinobacter salicampi TaxID=435907 RepID=UPI00140BE1CC|nr:Rieske (2Fe-2S) protein [Marinobacter salicampi]
MIRHQNPEQSAQEHREWQLVGPTHALGDKQCLEFTLGTTTGFVVRANGRLRGFVNRCPHLGIELNWMPERFLDSGGSFIQCATHGALFTLDTGECIAGPCAGGALTPLETRENDGQIEVRFSPE